MDLTRDFARLTEKLKHSKTVEVPFGTLGELEETFIHGLVTKGLAYVDQHYLVNTVQMIVSELVKNAEKSQLKRVYFEQEKIDPDDESAEQATRFGAVFAQEGRALRAALKKSKRKCEFKAQVAGGDLVISVTNPGRPSAREEAFIRSALQNTGEKIEPLASIEQAPDTGEGQGLGLVLSVLALGRAGLPPGALSLSTDKNTEFSLRIPGQHEPPDLDLVNRYIEEVDDLPALSGNLQAIIKICNSEKSDAKQVAREIEKDQLVASRVLKLANSGGFAGGNIADILEAVKIVGIGNIAGMLLNIGANEILEARYRFSDELREHPVRVAFYSRQLARKNRLAAHGDQAYVAGLLHDLGHVILMAGLNYRDDVQQLMRRNHLRGLLNMEELFCGISHATLGALLGDKWNFPESLINAIDLHHSPHKAAKEDRELVYLVYLANSIADYEDGKTGFFALEPEVMEYFNITTEQAFELIVASLTAEYNREQ